MGGVCTAVELVQWASLVRRTSRPSHRKTTTPAFRPALTLIFDTGNNSLHDDDNEATWRFWEGCKDHVTHIHIKAARPGDDGKWVTCYPDDDPVQARILADLQARGYGDWISIEPHLAAQIHAGIDVVDDVAATEIYVEYARRIEAIVNQL